ncbi:MAG: AIR carboxylase family protein, partial [Actinomycetota bacterium]|nr:AIR carboxylase family protein [Actinomycetota bacterium]
MTDIGTETEVLEDLGQLEEDAPRVGIIMGSKSDLATMEKAGEPLDDAGIRYEVRVMSAHREPEVVADYCAN